MRSDQIHLGSHVFKSKTAAKRHISEWMSKQPNGRIPVVDEPTIHDLFLRHPKYKERSKSGIDHFEIRPDHYGGHTRCLHVIDCNGNAVDFSYIACLDGTINKERISIKTFRDTIEDQIIKFKESQFRQNKYQRVVCPISGIAMEYRSRDCHVDHDFSMPGKTFRDIYMKFLEKNQLTLEDVYEHITTDGPYKTFKEPFLSNWQTFHHRHATLRLIHASANLSK